MTSMIARVLALVLCVSAVGISSQVPARKGESRPPQEKANPAEDKPAVDLRGTPDTPIVVKMTKTKEETAQDQRDREQEASNKRASIWLGAFTVLVLVIQLGVVVQQNRILGRQNTIMENQSAVMKGQHDAAVEQSGHTAGALAESKKAAEAAMLSAITARDALHFTQRAAVSFYGVAMVPHPKPCFLTGETQVILTLKNSGPTRATNVKITSQLLMPEKSTLMDAGPGLPTVTIAAGDELRHRFPPLGRLFPAETIDSASKGDVRFRFVAVVEYQDVFGNPHRSKNSGTYYGADGGGFVVDENSEED